MLSAFLLFLNRSTSLQVDALQKLKNIQEFITIQIAQEFNLLIVEDDPYYYLQYTEVRKDLH